MKLLKLTALFPLIALSLFLASCETDAEVKKTTDYQKEDIPMTGAQVVTPASNSAALGKLTVFYSKKTKLLNYSFSWSGLSGNPTAGIGLYGLAPTGFALNPTQPLQVISTSGALANGSRSGTLLVDDVVVKENNLLNGMYYILLRTAAYPGGEIRGQIVFQ